MLDLYAFYKWLALLHRTTFHIDEFILTEDFNVNNSLLVGNADILLGL